MGIVEILLLGVALSMDAFAVAVCKGLAMKRLLWGQALVIACFFGGFQALMPSIGWFLGSKLQVFIQSIDHWIAFVLLFVIGAKMFWEAFRGDAQTEQEAGEPTLDIKELFALAVATSIDALAVGVTFAFLEVRLLSSVTLIGATTFTISLAGVAIGHFFGSRWERPAAMCGGVVLILIGLKILLEHLGIIVF